MTKRIIWLDIAIVITAFLVVYTHLFTSDDPFRLWVYTFHMPLFFLISGFFHKDKEVFQSVLDNIYRLIIPAFFFLLLGLFVYTCIHGFNELSSCAMNSLRGIALGKNIPANNVIWFLFTLFWDNILLNITLRNKWFNYFLPILYVASFSPYFKVLHFSQAMFSFPFYMLGYVLKKNIKVEQICNKISECFALLGGGYIFNAEYRA